jgi:hypothetical protein
VTICLLRKKVAEALLVDGKSKNLTNENTNPPPYPLRIVQSSLRNKLQDNYTKG